MSIFHPIRNPRFVRRFERVMADRHSDDTHVPHEWRMAEPGEPAPRRAIYAGDAELIVAFITGVLAQTVILWLVAGFVS